MPKNTVLVIESGIPLPAETLTVKEQLSKMQVGDSFITKRNLNHFGGAAKDLGFKLVSQRQENGDFRVWRKA